MDLDLDMDLDMDLHMDLGMDLEMDRHPSAVPDPVCPNSYSRLCSLSVVICVFVCGFGPWETRKSRRIA